jgi:multidrug efflux pump subunit AcrB
MTEAVTAAAKIRLGLRLTTTIPIIMGLIPLGLGTEEGGDILQPMAVGAIGGLMMLLPVALFFMPCIYVISTREKKITVA